MALRASGIINSSSEKISDLLYVYVDYVANVCLIRKQAWLSQGTSKRGFEDKIQSLKRVQRDAFPIYNAATTEPVSLKPKVEKHELTWKLMRWNYSMFVCCIDWDCTFLPYLQTI